MVEESIAERVAAVCGLDRTPSPFMALRSTNLPPHKLLMVSVDTCTYLFNRPKALIIHGVKYAQSAVIRVTSEDDHEQPYIYCKISCLYVYNDLKVFVTNVLDIHDYIDHTKCFAVLCSTKVIIALYSDLYTHGVLHLKTKESNTYLVEKHKICNH